MSDEATRRSRGHEPCDGPPKARSAPGERHGPAPGVCANCDVRKLAICDALAGRDLDALEAIMTPTALDADQCLVLEGHPRERVYTLTAGMLRLSKTLPDGRRQITGFLLPGDYLGLTDGATHSATAEAVEPAELCGFRVDRMEALADRLPMLQKRLLKFTQNALRQAGATQMILGRMNPVERLACFLITFSERAVAHGEAASPVRLPMSRYDIADYLGLTIETVSRSFTKLRNQGIVAMPKPQCVAVTDRAALLRTASLHETSTFRLA